MRPRLELLAGFVLLLVLGTLAGLLGRRENREPDQDPRRSTFLAGPYGARGFHDALVGLGVTVERVRDRRPAWDSIAAPLVAVLGPTWPLDVADGAAIADASGDLLLAGSSSVAAMRCFGFAVERRARDSLPAVPPGAAPGATTPWVRAVLAATRERDTMVTDSTALEDAAVAGCAVVRPDAVDSLLVTPGGRLVAAALAVEGRRVVLVADDMLFSNRLLRATDAGVFALGLVAGRYDRIAVEEYHHGFGPQGSLAAAVLAWSAESPIGWGAWQLVLVGILALVAGLGPTNGALRFGPPRPPVGRARRSPLEHVQALATALSAARGHDVAIALTVQGLERRLSGTGRAQARPRGAGVDTADWLRQVGAHAGTPRARKAIDTLIALTRPGQPAASVLTAAHAVEDVWEELKP